MTHNEATKLVKYRGPSKYSRKSLDLLKAIVSKLYNPNDKDGDIQSRVLTRKAETIKGWIGSVNDRHFRRILKNMEEVRIISRKNGTIVCKLNLQSLLDAPMANAVSEMRKKAENTARAAKARAKRTENICKRAMGVS